MSLPRAEFFSPTDRGVACKTGEPYPEQWGDRWDLLMCKTADPIRRMWGGPLYTVCVYRSDAYNEHLIAIGRKVAKDSQHPKGNAADLQPRFATGRDTVLELHDMILRAYKVGQLPYLGGLGLYPDFVHIDTFKTPDGHLRRWNLR